MLLKKSLKHSAKGSEWEDHKYIKRIDGTYYYPDNYEGGRHLSNKDVKNLANETIRGNFGNGQKRKDLLGKNYKKIQNKVNEILGVKKTDKNSKASSKSKKSTEKAISKVKGIDLNAVYAVYKR